MIISSVLTALVRWKKKVKGLAMDIWKNNSAFLIVHSLGIKEQCVLSYNWS